MYLQEEAENFSAAAVRGSEFRNNFRDLVDPSAAGSVEVVVLRIEKETLVC
jgi:hypothetical protein